MDININGSIPVQIGADSLRNGLPDLDCLFGINLSLNRVVLRNDDGRIQPRIPVGISISTDLCSMLHLGWTAQSQFDSETHEQPKY